jgi:pilus assembly protein Flp/PilA
MKASLIRFWLDAARLGTSGATAVEYSLIAAGIALVIAASITTLGATVDGLFASVLALLK